MKSNSLQSLNSQQLRKLADLIDQRAAIDAQILAATSGITTTPPAERRFKLHVPKPELAPTPKRRNKMSAEGRARIAAAARRRWKNARIEGRNKL